MHLGRLGPPEAGGRSRGTGTGSSPGTSAEGALGEGKHMGKFIKAVVIIAILVTVYKKLGAEWVLDFFQDPAASIPSVEIGK